MRHSWIKKNDLLVMELAKAAHVTLDFYVYMSGIIYII